MYAPDDGTALGRREGLVIVIRYRRTLPWPCGRTAAYEAILRPPGEIALTRSKSFGTHPAVPGGAAKEISFPVTTLKTRSILQVE